jgi:hypothetical protein
VARTPLTYIEALFSVNSVQLFSRCFIFFRALSGRSGPASTRAHTLNLSLKECAVGAVAWGAVPDVLANGFVSVSEVFRILFEAFERRATDSFGIREVVRETSF